MDEAVLLARLRGGEEAAFADVVTAWSPVMLHVARGFVSTRASAQEVVQEAWLAVLRGLDGFQGRSALRTWVLAITANLARRRGTTDARTVPWTDVAPDDAGTVDPARFRGPGDNWAGGWTPAGAPQLWGPEAAALSGEVRALFAAALDALPSSQRTVVALRDVDGLSAPEVCAALGVSAANQRVLLHRARARLRQELEDYYHDVEVSS
ncbi:MAG: sigma-70 family RNA polymerase sigma factor [Intrasporangium sp.]|uniref:RNA polymerase sigma factor n=1 Tax=Intrasporangium sp. TaxID=1925024 RepID=UPI00264A25CA|nr:sigma-70 family RNA polymerase sigma factor [Intrasporangium sp.]MDN5797250.1 sigma-70 family RNA polymerase sigma factor [Intrasporangium sp.]